MYLPAHIGDYTDFYAGIHHAENVGRLFRPDNPLLPNYKWVPIGYHGRASSIRPSGPGGSTSAVPRASASRHGVRAVLRPQPQPRLELELGIWIGPGNALGTTIPIAEAAQHIAGYCLLNDWSARDIQGWEYQPLGPFLAKSFCTTVSPWIVTPEALAPFRAPQPPRPSGDPQPLPYLNDPVDQAVGALDLELEVLLTTRTMKKRVWPRTACPSDVPGAVLDARAAGRAPHLRRLQPEPRRPLWHRHHQHRRHRRLRLPPGDQPRRPRPDHPAKRRRTALPRRRRRGRATRPRPPRRRRADRLRRVPRRGAAGGVTALLQAGSCFPPSLRGAQRRGNPGAAKTGASSVRLPGLPSRRDGAQ